MPEYVTSDQCHGRTQEILDRLHGMHTEVITAMQDARLERQEQLGRLKAEFTGEVRDLLTNGGTGISSIRSELAEMRTHIVTIGDSAKIGKWPAWLVGLLLGALLVLGGEGLRKVGEMVLR